MRERPTHPEFTYSDLPFWQAANDECWRHEYWQSRCRDDAHYGLCMNSRGWYPREQTPFISPSAEPRYRFLYATYFWKSLLEYLRIPPIDGRVLELLSSRTLHVAVGLQSIGFRGQFDRIELETGIPACPTAQYASSVNEDDFFSLLTTPLHYDLVIGNHIIDDLILFIHLPDHHALQRTYVDRSFSMAVWADISAHATTEQYAMILTSHFLQLLRAMSHGHLILRHYPSTFDLRNSDVERINFLQSIFQLIRWKLNQCLPPGHVQTIGLETIMVPLGDRYPESVILCTPATQKPLRMPQDIRRDGES